MQIKCSNNTDYEIDANIRYLLHKAFNKTMVYLYGLIVILQHRCSNCINPDSPANFDTTYCCVVQVLMHAGFYLTKLHRQP